LFSATFALLFCWDEAAVELDCPHFQFLASQLFNFYECGEFNALLIGCHDFMWPEIESALHSELRDVLIGHFRIDPGLATPEQVQQRSEQLIREMDHAEELKLIEVATAGGEGNGRGAFGLPAVRRRA
jgi:hypothetical protein